SGFRPEERAELDRWLEHGWIDSFRALHPEEARYSWWSQRKGVREKNIGWRIDYVLLSPAARAHLRASFICTDVMGSDHCPIGVTLDDAVTENGGDAR
ncbi:MAG: endonuclease/exonuclease/phosphatase family protein, partial [Myxococcota bacterium]